MKSSYKLSHTYNTVISIACTEASAMTEPAWKDAGQKPGLQIWRIVVCILIKEAFVVYGKQTKLRITILAINGELDSLRDDMEYFIYHLLD